jgi:hypothetical protein
MGLAISLIIIGLLHKQSPDKYSYLLFTIGIGSFLYYMIVSGANLTADNGVVPDIRYMSAAYLPILIGAYRLAGSDKSIKLEIRTAIVVFSFILLMFLGAILISSMNYKTFSIIPDMIALGAVILSILLYKSGSKLVPALIAIPLAWQVTITFIFSYVKFNGYTFFIPLTRWMFSMITGGS